MIQIVSVGKIKDKHLLALINDYIDKIKHYDSVKWTVVDHSVVKKEEDQAMIDIAKKQEASRILKAIDSDAYVVALDLHGSQLPSEEVASWIEKANMNYKGKLTFVIAGSYGYDNSVLQRANYRWCLSKNTFLHTMVMLLTVEQIYRAFTIINHQTYHK